jgi:hypothetical protein
MLDPYEFEEGVKDDIVNFIKENKDRVRELSLRMVLKIADLKKSFPANYQAMARTTCFRRI